MKYVVAAIVGIFAIFLIYATFAPTGCYRPEGTQHVVTLKNAFNALSYYASDSEGQFPGHYDVKFLNECIRRDYFSEEDRADYVLKEAEPDATGIFLFPNRKQTSKGSLILAISEKPIKDSNEKLFYYTVTVAGKAEKLAPDQVVPLLIYSNRLASAPRGNY